MGSSFWITRGMRSGLDENIAAAEADARNKQLLTRRN
jgi:hypothetical protein